VNLTTHLASGAEVGNAYRFTSAPLYAITAWCLDTAVRIFIVVIVWIHLDQDRHALETKVMNMGFCKSKEYFNQFRESQKLHKKDPAIWSCFYYYYYYYYYYLAANILNSRGQPTRGGLVKGLTTHRRKKLLVVKCCTGPRI